MRLQHILWVTLSSVLLAACGNAEAPKAKGPKAPRGIFISTADCAATGKLSADDCGAVIERAIQMHEKSAKSYKTLNQCSKAEGADRCGKTVDGQYRARMQAFYIVMSKPPSGEPLYPPGAKSALVGFKSATQPVVSAEDDTLIVSSAALKLARENSYLP